MLKPVLIAPDCPSREATTYIAASLAQVYKAADDIFNKLEARLDKCNENTQKIHRRIDTIDQKVKALTTSKNAVLSHRTRYPDARTNYLHAIFEGEDFSSVSLNVDEPFKNEPISNQSLKDAITRKKDFGYAFSKGKHCESLRKRDLQDELEEGSCELFDEEFIFSEKAKLIQSKDKLQFETKSLLIYDSVSKEFENDLLAYKPGLGRLNSFDFPDLLPKLSGVTTPAIFSEGDFTSIAPSMRNEATSKDASTAMNLESSKEMYSRKSSPQPSKHEEIPKVEKAPLPDLPADLPPVSTTAAAPPPPPPPPPMPPVANVTAPPSMASPPPPPPPPPPPTLLPLLPPLPDLNKGRFDLMESIRNAGGANKAKLKAVSTTETSTPSPSKSKAADDTGDDLMASLAAALDRRRMGMAGVSKNKIKKLENKKSKGAASTDAFSRLRESVPVASKEDEEHDSDDGGEDWK